MHKHFPGDRGLKSETKEFPESSIFNHDDEKYTQMKVLKCHRINENNIDQSKITFICIR